MSPDTSRALVPLDRKNSVDNTVAIEPRYAGLRRGNPGNSGGRRGRSGRRSNAFNAALAKAAQDPAIIEHIAKIARGEATRTIYVGDQRTPVSLTPSFGEATQAAKAIWDKGLPKDEDPIADPSNTRVVIQVVKEGNWTERERPVLGPTRPE